MDRWEFWRNHILVCNARIELENGEDELTCGVRAGSVQGRIAATEKRKGSACRGKPAVCARRDGGILGTQDSYAKDGGGRNKQESGDGPHVEVSNFAGDNKG